MNNDPINADAATITTSKGKRFQITYPRVEDIDPDDVAIGLANASRWGGQTRTRYSVAQHSLVVARIVQTELEGITGATAFTQGGGLSVGRKLVLRAVRLALVHDASEAYTGDLAKPLKNECPDFRQIEDRLQLVIEERFRLQPTEQERAIVKHADRVALVAEGRMLFDGIPEWWDVDPSLLQASLLQAAEPAGNLQMLRFGEVPPVETAEMAWAFLWLDALRRTEVGP